MPRAPRSAIAWASGVSEPVQQVLRNTLRSACEVIGADAGFTLQTRANGILEVACAHRLGQTPLLDAVFGRAASALRRALVTGELGLANTDGQPLTRVGPGDTTPAVIALPLELGPSDRGVLCLMRTGGPRELSALDLEILGALADQTALALRAANQECALSKLAASLRALGPRPA
ncbi:GAF domain-containing protein [Sinimarinibacterium thermocellulolyticum]|uniref:GAF domain-containing protein n=1 Tax=Sinimarinibacterium thermocellulolyticum TaxID=3170016 RepID=A0ABV2A6Z0_9GAMM